MWYWRSISSMWTSFWCVWLPIQEWSCFSNKSHTPSQNATLLLVDNRSLQAELISLPCIVTLFPHLEHLQCAYEVYWPSYSLACIDVWAKETTRLQNLRNCNKSLITRTLGHLTHLFPVASWLCPHKCAKSPPQVWGMSYPAVSAGSWWVSKSLVVNNPFAVLMNQ